jgi:hypothetical protein
MGTFAARFFGSLIAVLMMGTAGTLRAQPAIEFTQPKDTHNQAGKDDPALAPTSRQHYSADQFDAPRQLFSISPEPMMAPPAQYGDDDQSWRDALNKRKNWTLMTPQEILGVPTPQKLLGIPDPNDDSKLSPEERFLKRSRQAAQTSATNALRYPDGVLIRGEDNPFEPRKEGGQFSRTDDPRSSDSTQNFNRLAALMPNRLFSPVAKADTAWSSAFDLPPPQAKPDRDQMAAMDRFHALMDSVTPGEPTATAANAGRSDVPVVDPNLEPVPFFNPLGHTFTPLQSGISKPTGLTPLSGVSAPAKLSTVTRPAWEPQTPPWLSDGPQPFGTQQRKF